MVVFHSGNTVLEGTLMKKRLIALLLVLVLVIPAGIASAASWYRVNTNSLKVRYLASEDSKVLGSYRRDYAAKISSTSNGWSYVTFSNGFKGYVQTKYLTKASSYKAWIGYDNTALRKGPDGGFSAIATLAKGTKVTVLSHGTKYDYVSAGDLGSGYVVNSRLSKKKVASSGNKSESNKSQSVNYDAWVTHTGKVNMRKSASTGSPVIAQYAPGTKVHVTYKTSEWSKIKVGSSTGWMMSKFLTTSKPAETPTPKPKKTGDGSYTAYVVTGNKKSVNVRKGNSTNYAVLFKVNYGSAVKVLKHNAKWDYIEYGGKKGYVQNNFLQMSKPKDGSDPTAKPTAKPTSTTSTRTITSPDGKSVNFHRGKGDGYSNVGYGRLKVGTVVTVLKYDGKWAQVEYKGYKGWIHKEFLK